MQRATTWEPPPSQQQGNSGGRIQLNEHGQRPWKTWSEPSEPTYHRWRRHRRQNRLMEGGWPRLRAERDRQAQNTKQSNESAQRVLIRTNSLSPPPSPLRGLLQKGAEERTKNQSSAWRARTNKKGSKSFSLPPPLPQPTNRALCSASCPQAGATWGLPYNHNTP